MSNKKFVKKEEKKNNFVSGILIFACLAIVVAILIVVSDNNSNKANGNNRIIEISYSEYKEKIMDDGYTIVLLASPSCSHCQDYKPFVNGLANEYDLDVYYVNVSSNDMTDEEYNELHDSISALKDQYNSGIPIIPTPTTVVLKNGVEVASILGDIGYDGLKEFLLTNNVIH